MMCHIVNDGGNVVNARDAARTTTTTTTMTTTTTKLSPWRQRRQRSIVLPQPSPLLLLLMLLLIVGSAAIQRADALELGKQNTHITHTHTSDYRVPFACRRTATACTPSRVRKSVKRKLPSRTQQKTQQCSATCVRKDGHKHARAPA